MIDECVPFVPKCRECGAYMIATSSRYTVCTNGHGKLVARCRRFNECMRRYKATEWERTLPKAVRSGRSGRKNSYSIPGHDGLYTLVGAGRPRPGAVDYVAACLGGRSRKFQRV